MQNFKNDKERIAFLEDYRNEGNGWRLWKHDEDMGRRSWRLDITDGSSLIVEEELRTFNWPKVHTTWSVMHWYIIEDWNSDQNFGDCRGSRTQALNKIKELGRKK